MVDNGNGQPGMRNGNRDDVVRLQTEMKDTRRDVEAHEGFINNIFDRLRVVETAIATIKVQNKIILGLLTALIAGMVLSLWKAFLG